MNETLRLLIITLLENKVTVASWGISNITINSNIMVFDVDGLKYKGKVSIKVTGLASYTIRIGDMSYSDCRLENLVNFIDSKVERTNEYLKDLKEWIEKKV